MASLLGKFELTFVFCEFAAITTNFLQKLVVNRTTAANFFPPNFVALLYQVTDMRTKVQMVDFIYLYSGSRSRILRSLIDHRWRQNVVRTKKWHTRRSRVCHWCPYYILTSSVIYYWTDARQHGMYLFYIIKESFSISKYFNIREWLPLPWLFPLWWTQKKRHLM